MNPRILTGARRAVLGAAALLLAAPASASAYDARTDNWLHLSVTRGDARTGGAVPGGARSSDTRGTLLVCDPPQGHGRAALACAELDAVGGDIGALPPGDGYCTMIYAPATARAHGRWDGRPVTYEETFPNACVLAQRTGSVFALDAG
ncbi:SSI family serine proteinase inhibitor [Streptomyces sp. NPDC090106]|uniref:SSI family serine proteinase inhibitor n=1 Tax=Streptomyces sp. NPDC090106 TaxID=3365946 RepID=UPI00380D06CE